MPQPGSDRNAVMAQINRFAAASALAAALSLAATPATARGYHHWHRWHHDGIDGGDVLAGALIIGGIAAIASAANRQDKADHEPVAPPPVPQDRQEYGYGEAAGDTGLDRAADMCADAVERGPNRVDSVDNVTRDRDGWSVSGALEDGAGFSCRIGNDGQVQGVNVAGPRADLDRERYGNRDEPPPPQAEAETDDAPAVDNRPVWHGDQPQPQRGDDGRYSTSQAPDFGEGV